MKRLKKVWIGEDITTLVFLKSTLHENNIFFVSENESLHGILPSRPYIILVSEDDYDRTKKIVEEALNENY